MDLVGWRGWRGQGPCADRAWPRGCGAAAGGGGGDGTGPWDMMEAVSGCWRALPG